MKKNKGNGTFFVKKEKLLILFLIIALIIGIMIVLYPTFSNYYNSFHQTYVVEKYEESVNNLEDEKYSEELAKARRYNEELIERINQFYPSSEEHNEYMKLLNLTGDNIMGYIVIPKINCIVPIYHGVEEKIMQIGIGHIEGSSLPVGGNSTHCVLSGHRGLPQSKLFTNLNELEKGDKFEIHVLGKVMHYEVDNIIVVEPDEMDKLLIEEGKDLCTLVTCTPFAINTHRLLVRGTRIEYVDKTSNNEILEKYDKLNINILFKSIDYRIVIIISLIIIIIIIAINLFKCRK